jgi:hypothetical protein
VARRRHATDAVFRSAIRVTWVGSMTFADDVISPRPMGQTTYNDPLATLVLLRPKTHTYVVRAVWPNVTKRLNNLATIKLRTAKQVSSSGVTKCLTAFDLPAQLKVESEVSQILRLHVVLTESSPFSSLMTVTVSNSLNPTKFPNVSY